MTTYPVSIDDTVTPKGEDQMETGDGGPIRVVVVDDHPILRNGVTRLLQEEPGIEVVGEAENAEDALLRVERFRPDVVLIDIDMPGMGGIEGTRRILDRHPNTRVVILSMHAEPGMAKHAFDAGACGYVVKTAADTELVTAITTVAGGGRYVNASMGAALASPEPVSPIADLTEREVEVLRMIALGHSNQEIAATLYLSVRTVETHRAHILRKLGLQTRADMVRVALESGLLDLPPATTTS
jgi:DNA-binding NarL/FixJ family response regulator